MGNSYLPGKEADLRDFLQEFSAGVTAHAVALGLDSSTATALASLVTSFENAYQLAKEKATRTSVTIDLKNRAKAAVIADVRALARRINDNPAVTSDMKIALGLHPRDVTPTPIPAPQTRPVLSVIYVSAGEVWLKIVDETGVRKPFGVLGAEVFAFAGDNPPAEMADFESKGLFTRRTVKLSFKPTDVGKLITIGARWYTARGLTGAFGQSIVARTFGGAIAA